MTKIYLQKSVVDGQTKIDLIGEGIPKNFLGLATDLKVSNNSGEALPNFSLQKVELGNAFNAQPEQFKPILLYKAEQQKSKIVFGLSLKANNLAEVKDGVLASFYISDAAANFAFDQQVLSVFEEGRKDLNDVLWVNSANYGQSIVSNELIKAENNAVNKEISENNEDLGDAEVENWLGEGIIELMEEKSPLNWLWKGETELKDGNGVIFWGIGFGLLILAIGLVVVFRKRLFALIKWPKKSNLALEKA